MKRFGDLKKTAKAYLRARKKFRKATDKIPELNGNDNLVGRIGEFVAFQFLQGKLKRKKVIRNTSAVQKGYDIIADGKKVSVKIITSENISGRTTPIRDPWDELIFIDLGENAKIKRIGVLGRKGFEQALKNKFIKNRNPIARRSMLNATDLIGNYGKIYSGDDVKGYL